MKPSAGFFETAQELDQLRAWSAQTNTELMLVALTPEADAAAEQRGLTYHSIEDLYMEEDLVVRGLAQFEILERFCDAVDEALHANAGPVSEVRHFSLRYEFQFLKMIMDALLHRTATLASALETLAPQAVVYCRYPSDVVPAGRWAIPSSVSRWLLPFVAEQRGCQAIGLTVAARPPARFPGMATQLKRCVRSASARAIGLGRWLRRHHAALVGASRPPGVRGSQEATLVLTGLWSDRDALQAWLAEGGRLIHWRTLVRRVASPSPDAAADAELEAVVERCWNALRHDAEVRALFRIDGVDLAPLVEQPLRSLFADLLSRHCRISRRMDAAFKTVSHPIVLGSTFVRVEEVACAAAARRAGIPVIAYQHGGFLGYVDFPMQRFCDMGLPDYYLSYGRGVSEAMERFSGQTIPVTIGSSDLDRLMTAHRKPGRRPGRTAVYVVTLLMGDRRYFTLHAYPDIQYWRLQRQVIERLSHADIELIVKLDPRDMVPNPLKSWARRQRVKRCRFVRDVSFAEVLGRGDLIIIDSPSTTLLQALATHKPVIAFADRRFIHFTPEATGLLRKRAVFSTTPEEFFRDIDAAVHTPSWGPVSPVNDEFLSRYGTHENDGGSARRAAQALWDIARHPRDARGEQAPAAFTSVGG